MVTIDVVGRQLLVCTGSKDFPASDSWLSCSCFWCHLWGRVACGLADGMLPPKKQASLKDESAKDLSVLNGSILGTTVTGGEGSLTRTPSVRP